MNLEQLYQEYKSMVYNLALHYVQNVLDAQEITQDVFVAIYLSADSFRGASSKSTWIYRITINKSLDFIKAKKRKKRIAQFTSLFFEGSAEPKHFLTDEASHPGIQLENKESLNELFRFLNQLPDQQRTALILHKIEQKSQIEVAEIMNTSAKAVESLVQRAKTNLSKKIKESEGNRP